MKIHYFASEPWEEAYVRTKMKVDNVAFHEGPLSTFPDLKDNDTETLCIFIDSHIGESELDRFPSLKFIATRSTGFDHINLAAAKARGITVATVPFYGENTVAEFAFALLLSLSRRISEAEMNVKTGGFSPTGLRGFDLAGKTIGVVGTGHIGAHAIRIAQGFGMKIVGFDAYPNAELAKTLGFTYAPLEELFMVSDIVTLHVPYNAHTHHLVNKENIRAFKKGSYLINTSRGAVVETEALVEALRTGTLAGAGLDVLEEEGDMADETLLLVQPHPNEDALKIALANHYIIEHPRVLVTPHTAFNTTEAITRILDASIENIRHFSEGSPTNVVS